MRISDWSSYVGSSDLIEGTVEGVAWRLGHAGFACGGEDDGSLWLGDGQSGLARFGVQESARADAGEAIAAQRELDIGRTACRGRGGKVGKILVACVALKEQTNNKKK